MLERIGAQPTFGRIMAEHGATAGFEYLRLFLAISVLATHSGRVTFGADFADDVPVWVLAGMNLILPMFFSLSGFLVTSSLLRLENLRVFLAFRGLRIFPALTVEVLLSALLLGPVMTALPLGAYVQDPGFWRYFANAVGVISFELPAVFDTHLVTEVNGSLWTVPYELECYIALTLLALLTVTRRPFLALIIVFGWGAYIVAGSIVDLGAAAQQGTFFWQEPDQIYLSEMLIPSFLAGMVLRLLADRVPMDGFLGLGTLLLSCVLISSPRFYGLAIFPIAYATAWLGLLRPPMNRIIRSGDYSYGIYLYAYPIQQTVYAVVPLGASYLGNLSVSLILACLFAALSWHGIEKPALSLKRRFFGRAARRAGREGTAGGGAAGAERAQFGPPIGPPTREARDKERER